SSAARVDLPRIEAQVRAMRLALDAQTRSDGKFITMPQADRAAIALQDFLQKNPEGVEERLVLAASHRHNRRLEDAIAVLRAGQNVRTDPRCGKMLAECSRELDKSGELKAAVTIVGCQAPSIMGAIYQSYHDNPAVELTLSNDGNKATQRGKALFLARAIMDTPTETELPPLLPFTTVTFKLKAIFNRNIGAIRRRPESVNNNSVFD
ncbi:MAG: hypothetical protein AAB956_01765, partial [Patescibacteria group bacterium]